MDNRAIRGSGQTEQIQRLRKCLDSVLDRHSILVAFRNIFKADDVCAGCLEFHHDAITLERDIQMTDTMFMGPHITPLLCEQRHGVNHK